MGNYEGGEERRTRNGRRREKKTDEDGWERRNGREE